MWPVPPIPPPDDRQTSANRQTPANGPWIAVAIIVAAVVVVVIVYLATSSGGGGY